LFVFGLFVRYRSSAAPQATSAPEQVETGNVARWLNEPEKIQHFITTTSKKMGLAFSFE